MKKCLIISVVLAVLFVVSLGLNIFQLVSGAKTEEKPIADLKQKSIDPELPKNYFVILFEEEYLNYLTGPIIAYGMDGSIVFEASFGSLPSSHAETVWVEYEMYGYGFDWFASYLDAPLEISRLKIGAVDFGPDTIIDHVLYPNHVYGIDEKAEFRDLTSFYLTSE